MNVGSYRSALFGPLNSKKSLPKFSIGDRTILNKRIHTNPKFISVSSKTDSGFNARRKEELQKEIQTYYKVTNNEVFSRLSLSELMQLMIAYSHEWSQYKQQQGIVDQGDTPGIKDDEEDTITQMEGLKVKNVSHAEAGSSKPLLPPSLPPYLLVDVRTPVEFHSSHLIGAVNHQLARLSRSVNWESRELLLYRNHPDRIIILYDLTEDLVPEYASTLIHRGYENIYVLSGGLKLSKDKFGYPLVVDKASIEKKAIETLECQPSPSSDEAEGCTPNLSEKNLFKLTNAVLPLDVCETLTDQLSHVILPPLSTKGLNAERWIQYGPDCTGLAGRSSCSVSKERASGMSTSRSTLGRGAGSTVSCFSKSTKDGQKPWR